MTTDMKATKPCTRRVIRATGMICKPPRRGNMSSTSHIAAHRAHKLRIDITDCQGCQMATEEVIERKKPPETYTVPPNTPLPWDNMEVVEMPPQKPREAHMKPPAIAHEGVINYVRTSWEPPPTPPGYQRADTETEWVLKPREKPCKHLELGFGGVGSCGYPRLTYKCQLVNSFVGPKTCKTCPKRE